MEYLPKKGAAKSRSVQKQMAEKTVAPKSTAKASQKVQSNRGDFQTQMKNMSPAQQQEFKQMLQELTPAQLKKIQQNFEQPKTQQPPVFADRAGPIGDEVLEQELINSKQLHNVKLKRKSTKPANAPKRASVPYMCFLKANHDRIKEQNPNMKQAAVVALIGKEWREMTDEQKQPYILQSEKDKIRHQNQMAEFVSKGYFTLEDGSKSTDALQADEQSESSPKKALTTNSLQVSDPNSTMTTQSSLSAKSLGGQKKVPSKNLTKRSGPSQDEIAQMVDSPTPKNVSQKRQRLV